MNVEQMKNQTISSVLSGSIIAAAIWAGGALTNSQVDVTALNTKLDAVNANVSQLREDIRSQREEDKRETARWIDQHETRIQRLEAIHQQPKEPR